jgi:glycosidase
MKGVEWFKDAIIYHVFIDRFAGYKSKKDDKPVFVGGNIKGIIKKLPYIKSLGVNTLWISPFCKTSAYHGYHITDFFKVDPHFGTLKDLKNLIKKVHDLDMKIIAGFVSNHFSWKHPYFLEAQKNKNSKYFKWFYFEKWPNDYLTFLHFKELPKLNLDYKPARNHIIKSAKYWLKFGLDGFRLDHAVGPSDKFWKIFRKEIKKKYPDAILIGEVGLVGVKLFELETIRVKDKYVKWFLGEASDELFKSYIGELDGVMDFKFRELIKDFIAKKSILRPKWLLKSKLKKHFSKYPKNYFLPLFLDNHDMDRFLFESGNDKNKLREAAKIQFSLKQPPIIYYGTEIGMSQQKSRKDFKEYGDLQARKLMDWENQDKKLLAFYKNIIRKKKSKHNTKHH